MKLGTYLLLFVMLLTLVACDQRNSSKLPTGLSPFDYISSNYISDTSKNYLVKSQNSDAYVFIRKEAFEQNILKKGDWIWLSKQTSFSAMDSLVIPQGEVPVTDSYYFYVYRDSTETPMQFNDGMITLYTPPKTDPNHVKVLHFDETYITSDPVTGLQQSEENVIFPLAKTGFLQFYSEQSIDPQLQFEATGSNMYVFHPSFSMFIPADDAILGKTVTVSKPTVFSENLQNQITSIFPSFAVSEMPLTFSISDNPTLTNFPVIHIWKEDLDRFSSQMVVIRDTTPPMTMCLDAATNLWTSDVSFFEVVLKYTGEYCLVQPIAGQNQFTLPLDGTYSKIYLNHFYLNLQDINLSNTTLGIDFTDYTSQLPAVWNGSVYQLSNLRNPFTVSIRQNGSELFQLPDSLWIEAGFSTDGYEPTSSDRLYTYYIDNTMEKSFYSKLNTAYDSLSYCYSDGYVYFPLAVSGKFALAQNSNDQPSIFQIPISRDAAYYQTEVMDISYSGALRKGLSHYYLNMHPTFDTSLMILHGYPYNMAQTPSVIKSGFLQNGNFVETVPTGYALILHNLSKIHRNFNHTLLYSNADGWTKCFLLKRGNSTDLEHFSQQGENITYYPAVGGYLLMTNLINLSNTDILFPAFNKIYVDYDRIKFYANSTMNIPDDYKVHVRITPTMPDTRHVLSTQYNLTQTSWNYHVDAYDQDNAVVEDFLQDYQPVLSFTRNQRSNPLLIHLNRDSDYRIYTYPQGDTLTGFNFSTDDNYHSIVACYNGEYCAFSDNDTHSSVLVNVTESGVPIYVSLYQAQLSIPAYFVGTALPVGSKIGFSQSSTTSGSYNLIQGYDLRFLDADDQAIDPNFITTYMTQRYPYLFLPFPPETDTTSIHVRYINPLNVELEYTRVTDFSNSFPSEYKIIGNCVVLHANNRGRYLITSN